MDKFRLEVELDVWVGKKETALREIANKLEEVQQLLRSLPNDSILEDVKLGGSGTGGLAGAPHTVDSPGWKCVWSLKMPND